MMTMTTRTSISVNPLVRLRMNSMWMDLIDGFYDFQDCGEYSESEPQDENSGYEYR